MSGDVFEWKGKWECRLEKVASKRNNELSKREQIFLLECLHRGLVIKRQHVPHSTTIQPDPVLPGQQNLARIEVPDGEPGTVDCLEGVGDLGDIGPENPLGWR